MRLTYTGCYGCRYCGYDGVCHKNGACEGNEPFHSYIPDEYAASETDATAQAKAKRLASWRD